MARRKIITIDEDKCNGCGDCVTACSEGALAIVNGKAKLVKEQFCDGFGDCIGECPTGALRIEERDSEEFDIEAVKASLLLEQGEEAVKRMEAAQQKHEAGYAPRPGGCPGMMQRVLDGQVGRAVSARRGDDFPGQAIPSELRHWPVQIHLVQPGAEFFKGKELVVLSTCAPIASADVHWRFIRGRGVVVGCPKLDRIEPYAEKLGAILSEPSIPRVLVVRMEVPCCGGLTAIVLEAAKLSGRKDLVAEEVTVAVDGTIMGSRRLEAPPLDTRHSTLGREDRMNAQDEIKGKAVDLAGLVDYAPGAVVSKTLVDKKVGTLTVFSFDEGQGLSEHTAPYDATVQILDGEAEITIGGKPVRARAGQLVIMPANVPHSLRAVKPFKMLLIMIRA
ncbi:MAG: cupin domain-containing protein [Kiritimatiellae bacterium]|nr:cupin domain-containing protein [Kiritimatiellia bacterium]